MVDIWLRHYKPPRTDEVGCLFNSLPHYMDVIKGQFSTAD